MSGIADIDRRPARWLAWLAGLGVVANLFVVAVVNYRIYWARAEYIAGHPDRVAKRPPTISQSLADPAIQEVFAFWVAIGAVLLFVGVLAIVTVQFATLPQVSAVSRRGRRVLLVTALTVVPIQAVACVGMVMLSQYTFPAHRDAHMMGSYIFFGAQAVVVMIGLAFSAYLARDRVVAGVMEACGVIDPRANRVRLYVGAASVALVVLYVTLFFGKDHASGDWQMTVFHVYTTTEPLCISSFLLFVLLYTADLGRSLMRYRRVAPVRG